MSKIISLYTHLSSLLTHIYTHTTTEEKVLWIVLIIKPFKITFSLPKGIIRLIYKMHIVHVVCPSPWQHHVKDQRELAIKRERYTPEFKTLWSPDSI